MKEYKEGEFVFCYGTDENRNEIDYMGHVLADMGNHVLVLPLFEQHDALIVPKEYVV